MEVRQYKRVIIAHGWADDPSRGWIAWLVHELEQHGIAASAPAFPNPKQPDITLWLTTLEQAVDQPDEQLVLVGHSLGALLVLNYLSQPLPHAINSAVLVAGFAAHRSQKVTEWTGDLDFDRIKANVRHRYSVFCPSDAVVTPERSRKMAQLVQAEEIEVPDAGHFAGLHGYTKAPEILQLVLDCYQAKNAV